MINATNNNQMYIGSYAADPVITKIAEKIIAKKHEMTRTT